MRAHLKEAIDALEIQDVYIVRSNSYLRQGFDPKYSSEVTTLSVQFKHLVEKSEVLQLSEDNDENNENNINIFRVYIALGARWVPLQASEEEEEVKAEAQIEAMYIAEYLMKEKISQEALDAFALNNASYHVWPYWREFVMNQCVRMNLPKVALPTLQLARNRELN